MVTGGAEPVGTGYGPKGGFVAVGSCEIIEGETPVPPVG